MQRLALSIALLGGAACGSPVALAPPAAELPAAPPPVTTPAAPAPSPVPTADRIARVENGLVVGARVHGRPPATLADRMRAHHVHGVSVAVIDHFAVAWAKGYGEADAETHAAVTETTLFQAGSISKPVAAVAALALVERGKLALDAPIASVLTSWKLPENALTRATPVTLKHLLSHTGGLTVHGFPGYAAGEPVPTLQQILDGAPPANTDPVRVDLPPGTTFRYSGGGITIMQAALADVTHEPFPRLLAETVLGPLGMQHSTYEQPLPPDRVPDAAAGYDDFGEPVPGKRHVYPEMAAAGLWTTPGDLARFAIELGLGYAGKSARVLSTDMTRRMLTPVAPIGDNQAIGLAVFLDDHSGTPYFGHNGADEGFQAVMTMDRDGGRGAVVMVNSDDGTPLAREILRAIAIEYGWPHYVGDPVDVVALDTSALAPLEGAYLLNADRIVRLRAEGGHLVLRTPFQEDAELLPVSPSTFVRMDDDVRYTFARTPEGVAVKVDPPDQWPVCRRVREGETVALDDVAAGRIEAAVKRYRAARAAAKGDDVPVFSEQRLNRIGLQSLRRGEAAQALLPLRVNVALSPDSMNAYDSLGEAYLRNGDRRRAIATFRQSLAAFARDKKTPRAAREALRENARRRLTSLGVRVP
jgi:CubicO group peptidase (beta-lactamase class C family)